MPLTWCAGIHFIYFHGDSYMRHIYAAMLITLTEDYAYGSNAAPHQHPQCAYHTQFSEKSCNYDKLKRKALLCDDSLEVVYEENITPVTQIDDCKMHRGSVKLWSFGNHVVRRWTWYGINDPTAYEQLFVNSGFCDMLRSKSVRCNST